MPLPPGRTSSTVSNPRASVAPPPRTQSTSAIPKGPTTGRMLAMQLGTVENAVQAQKHLLASGFEEDDEVTQFDSLLGARGRAPEDDEDEATSVGLDFDGETPAKGVTSRDLFKALNPPLQSREGRRSADLYRRIIDQFAVGKNPRYDPDDPQKPRAHIFVWDVTRAMNVEIPHFVGARELTLGLTVDWLRHEGPMRGWRKTDEMSAWEAANEGLCVVAVPREVRLKLMAVARPGDFNTDGKPFLSAAAIGRGNGLSTQEAFGVFAVEFFVHA